jgi:L-aspartate oxidase
VREAKERVNELIALGVGFDSNGGAYDLHIEGGHSSRRVLHAKDATGAEIMRALVERARAHPNIVLLEEHMAIDLITEGWLARRQNDLPPARDRVLGAYVLDTGRAEVTTIAARVTALCTGGAGKVYLYTTNPDIASGDGIAMGYRAGARVANMEFVQFHPTCLYHPDARNFLITEAMRGEGGILQLENGERFMGRYDPRKELAPRDIVARAIDAELKRTGDDCVYLDMTHLGAESLVEKFPNVYATCLQFGIDITEKPIPVVPRRTTSAAASSPICRARPTSGTSSRSARPRAPVSTAPIASRATRSSRPRASRTTRAARQSIGCRRSRRAPICRPGIRERRRSQTSRS